MNILLAMLAAFLWGTTYAVTQYTLSGWPPLLLGMLRALPAGLLLLALKPNLPKRKDWPILCLLGSINIALFFSLLFVMAQTLPSAISSVGMVSLPVFALFYYWIFYQQTPTRLQLLSGALLITCAWLLFDPFNLTLNPIGLSAMLAAIACILVGSNLTKKLGARIHWWPVLCWQLILGGAILGLIALAHAFINPRQYIAAWNNINGLNIIGLMWLIVLNTMLAYSLYVWLLSKMSVVEFTFAGISNPIAGILMGLILIGDSFSLHQYLLMGAMIATSLIAPLVNHQRRKKDEQD